LGLSLSAVMKMEGPWTGVSRGRGGSRKGSVTGRRERTDHSLEGETTSQRVLRSKKSVFTMYVEFLTLRSAVTTGRSLIICLSVMSKEL